MKNVGCCVHESKVVDAFTMTRWHGCRKHGGRCEKRGCSDFERERRVAFRLPAKAAGEDDGE